MARGVALHSPAWWCGSLVVLGLVVVDISSCVWDCPSLALLCLQDRVWNLPLPPPPDLTIPAFDQAPRLGPFSYYLPIPSSHPLARTEHLSPKPSPGVLTVDSSLLCPSPDGTFGETTLGEGGQAGQSDDMKRLN